MLKNIKNQRVTTNKGITLIALVVTIVVLLILAGITITALLSDGGIFNTAKRAQTVQDEAAIREKVQIMLADAQLEKLVNNTGLKAYLTSKGYTVTEDATAGAVTIPVDGYNVTIDEDTLEITGMTKADGSGNEGGTNPPSNPTIAVTGVSLDKETETMTVGGSLTLVATVAPETASNKAVTWTSSVPAVAEVNNGVVSAKAAGDTTITVTTEDGSFTDTCEITINEPKLTVADYMTEAVETNTYTEDKYGNEIVIPAGFKVLANGTNGVEYDYDKNAEGTSTGEPVVQDGIVIQHKDDLNEFVWVPVGETVNNAEGTNTTEIKLGRYDNINNGFIMDTSTTPPTSPLPFQEASKTDYNTVSELIKISSTATYGFFENSTGTYNVTKYNGTKFATLGSWISNTLENGGYYIGRYEASYGKGGVALTKESTGTPAKEGDYTSSTVVNFAEEFSEGQLWNFINQPAASTASKAMYKETENLGYYSELVNSYAWDTAIIFIQMYENVDYANQDSLYKDKTTKQPANTGERGTDATIGSGTTDKACNIYDMASNLPEWTTETNADTYNPCVSRGGDSYTTNPTSWRNTGRANNSAYYDTGFRPLLNCNAES